MSLNSHWFQNDSRQSWKNEKKVRLSKEALTKTDFVYTLSTLTSGHFGTTGS